MCRFCFQVLDWIENHGEAFLSKHTGVGKSLHRARALQKRHEDFEEVAQVAFCHEFSSSLIAIKINSYFFVLFIQVIFFRKKQLLGRKNSC